MKVFQALKIPTWSLTKDKIGKKVQCRLESHRRKEALYLSFGLRESP